MTARSDAAETPLTTAEVAQIAKDVITEVERAVIGKREAIELVLIGVLAGGHVLLEDVPGLAKTLIVRSLAGPRPRNFPNPIHPRPHAIRRHRFGGIRPGPR